MKKIIFVLFCIFLLTNVLESYSAEQYELLFDQANRLAQAEKNEEAIKLYEKVIELNPNFAPAYNNLGMIYQFSGLDIAEVVWYFKTAIDADPKFDQAYVNLGKAYYNMGHFDLAERYTSKALEVNPRSDAARLSLGWICLLGKSRPDEALTYFKDVSAHTQHPSVFFGLGMAYFMSGDGARALEYITILREMGEDDLATQLETIIRGNEYQRSQQDQPLLRESENKVDPFVASAPVRTTVGSPSLERITVTGTIPVRLKGKLNN
ncbi:MAG: tetratricopeptide repeat protein [Candidatus Aceula lacicola]|nr:tetratricopeptide repeat protein [Candidatus Aceula lacicola]